MDKELHIWLNEKDFTLATDNIHITLNSTLEALHRGEKRVDTTQTYICNTRWIQKGYRLFVHLLDGKDVEIKFGVNENGRVIKEKHNLERLLLANEFGEATINM